MSVMSDLAIYRVVALGALSAGTSTSEKVYLRAQTLVDMALEQVFAYLNKSEADVIALGIQYVGVASSVAADAVSQVLGHNSTNQTGSYDMDNPPASLLLSDVQLGILDRIFTSSTGGSRSFNVDRDANSTWLNGYDPLLDPNLSPWLNPLFDNGFWTPA